MSVSHAVAQADFTSIRRNTFVHTSTYTHNFPIDFGHLMSLINHTHTKTMLQFCKMLQRCRSYALKSIGKNHKIII